MPNCIAKALDIGALQVGLVPPRQWSARYQRSGRPRPCIYLFLPDLVDPVDLREILGPGDIEGICRSRSNARSPRSIATIFPWSGPNGLLQDGGPGVGMEVVQGAKAGDQWRQGRGNVGIAGVGVVVLPVHAIAMDFGVECLRHLACGAAKVHKEAPGGYSVQPESVLREPLGDLAEVLARRPELARRIAAAKASGESQGTAGRTAGR